MQLTTQSHLSDHEVWGYLLGRTLPDEAASLEQRYFADPALVERIHEVETDLVRCYLERSLSAQDQSDFERHYLASSTNRERLEIARGIREIALRRKSRRTAWVRVGGSLAAGLLLGGLLGMQWGARSQPASVAQTEPLQGVDSTPTAAAPASAVSLPTVVEVKLIPDLLRANPNALPDVALPNVPSLVRFFLTPDDTFTAREPKVQLLNAKRAEVMTIPARIDSDGYLVVDCPTAGLKAGAHEWVIRSGRDVGGSFPFRFVQK